MGNQLPIIIIDDDELQLQLVYRAMKRFHDVDVTMIDSGAAGLVHITELADTKQAAIILLDLHMPGIAGYDILKYISKDEKYNILHVIILSTSDEPEDIIFARKLGFRDYLVKPTRHNELSKKIDFINENHFSK